MPDAKRAPAPQPGEYRIGSWIIRPHLLAGGAWEFVHEQYDGPGDGSPEERDPRCGFGQTLEDVLEQITEIEEEVSTPDFRQTEERWVCPECGPGVLADEDGCCTTCGRDCGTLTVRVEGYVETDDA